MDLDRQELYTLLDFRTLEAVIWIGRRGSFSEAAERMNTTQPAISHRVQQFEQSFGVQLFHRVKPRVLLTDQGRDFIRYAEPIMHLREQLVTRVAQPEKLTGRLSLGVVETIVLSWLPSFLRFFCTAHPNIEIKISVNDSPTLRSRLLAYDLDLAFITGSVEDPVIRSRLLSRSRMGFVGSVAARYPEKILIQQLAETPLITFARGSSMRTVLGSLFDAPGLPQPQVHTSNSLATIVHMVREGLGLGFIPLSVASSYIRSGELMEVKTSLDSDDISFSACWLATPAKGHVALAVDLAVQVAAEYENN